MTPFDPARPRTPGNVPAWLDAPHIALPSLVFTPTPDSLIWNVKFMFPAREHSRAFHWVGKEFVSQQAGQNEDRDSLEDFLFSWWNGPEEAVKQWFDLEPPSGRVWRISRDDPQAELESTKTAEELGL